MVESKNLTAADQKRAELRRQPKVKREDMALTMRMSGTSHQAIAASFGYKRVNTVEKLIQGALRRRVDETADLVRTMDLDRLDRMLAALWPQIIAGDQGAIKTGIRIMQQKADILPGLAAATRLAGYDGGTIKVETADAARDQLKSKLIDLAERRRAREAS